MRRYVTILCLAMVLAMQAHGQWLYQISGNGSMKKSYLLATSKYVNYEAYFSLPAKTDVVLQNASYVITEYSDNSSIMKDLLAKVAMNTCLLSSYYTADERKMINAVLLEYLNISFDDVQLMRPAFVTQMIRDELMSRYVYNPNDYVKEGSDWIDVLNLDEYVSLDVYSYEKDIISLDSREEMLYMLFDKEPIEWQAKELLNLCKAPMQEVNQQKALVELYRQGQLNQMAFETMMPDNHTTISYSDYQVYARRNKEWVKRLKPYLKKGNCFIQLDAMYLGGDEGLIAQLRKAGYRVKAIKE